MGGEGIRDYIKENKIVQREVNGVRNVRKGLRSKLIKNRNVKLTRGREEVRRDDKKVQLGCIGRGVSEWQKKRI